MASQSPHRNLAIAVPPGPLGVTVQRRGERGLCVVTSADGSTELRADDIIISLNGITLEEVEGGVKAWEILFVAFAAAERNLVVERNESGSRSGSASHPLASANATPKPSFRMAAAEKKQAPRDSSANSSAAKKPRMIDDYGPNKDHSLKKGCEVISLLDDSNDEDISRSNPDVQEVSASSASVGWRRTSSLPVPSFSRSPANLKDDRSYSTTSGNAGNQDASNSDDEDLAIVATKGQNALADFPHSRANCVTHPFATSDKRLHCANCYCYVCDVPANECKEWSSHCAAYHEDERWQEERERAKRRARELAALTNALVSSTSTSGSSRSLTNTSSRPAPEFSVRKLFEKVTTVHPVEMSPPVGSGFVTTLRHYQKQSLAFMVEKERTLNRGDWLCDEVGMGKSAVVLALAASNRASLNTLATTQQINQVLAALAVNDQRREKVLREYRVEMESVISQYNQGREGLDSELDDKQREVEEDQLWDHYSKKKGVVMRKKDEACQRLASERRAIKKVKLKTTVVLTSVSLIGQWEDEARKHAPGLVVKTFHPSRKKNDTKAINLRNNREIPNLKDVDVVLSTSTFQWPSSVTDGFEFHRIVHDESHLLGSSASAKISSANVIISPRRWGITATPMTTSCMDLLCQLSFIEGSSKELNSAFSVLRTAVDCFKKRPAENTFNHLIDQLQPFMVRHTKSQRINGSAALSLPPSTTSTIMLEMTPDEDLAFNKIHVTGGFTRHLEFGISRFTAEKHFLPPMPSILRSGEPASLMEVVSMNGSKTKRQYIPHKLTKICALRADLARHRMTEPHLRAVVFTQHLDVHDACARGLEQDGFTVYQFTGSTASLKRDAAIRDFQNTASRRPAVFLVTLRSGNVGITLTAAHRVYLMEPCIDSTMEFQAAGRIHRLGQTSPCHVVRFAFKQSYEENIIKLHKEIVAGRISIVDGFVPAEAMKLLAQGLV